MTAAAELLTSHLAEMTTRCSAVYGLFPLVEAAPLPAPVKERIARDLAALADFVVWQELAADSAVIEAALKTALTGSVLPADELVSAWRRAVEASLPARRSATLVLHRFVPWVEQMPQASRALLMGDLQILFSHADDLGEEGIQAILADIVSCGGGDEPAVAAAILKPYAEADAEHLRAIAFIATLALRSGRRDLLDALTRSVTFERMMDEEDAARVLPATAAACRQSEQAACGAGLAVLETVVFLAAANVSSAYAVARRVQRVLKRLPAASVGPYLSALSRLVRAAGPRLVGFALDRLPELFRKNPEGAQTLVEAAAALAERGGTCAVEWLVQRRTAAARAAFGAAAHG